MAANPWDIDLPTVWWIVWVFAFFIGEAIGARYGDEMFTHHIWWVRNWAYQTGSTIVLFLIYALLLWINFHFIREGWRFFQ